MVTGPPGVGKSTIAPLVSANYPRTALIAGDQFFGFLDRGSVPPWQSGSQEQNETVVAAAALAAGRFVQGGYGVIYDGVIGPWFVPTFLGLAGVEQLHYAVLMRPLADCQAGVRHRVGHGFTDLDATAEMYRQFTEATSPAHLVNASREPAQVAAEIVRRVADGTLAIRATD